MEIKDSGSRREFSTGAHRDNAKGKGRCDLLPLRQVAKVMADKNGATVQAQDSSMHVRKSNIS